MKKNIKLAFAAFALLAFTACGNDSSTATEDTETVETDMNMESDMNSDTTIEVQETPVKDGVVDEMEEQHQH